MMGVRRALHIDRWALMLLPGLAALTTVFFLPIVLLATNSFHPNEGLATVGPNWTLTNYVSFLTDTFYLGILFNTFELAAIVVIICMLIGYPVAYFLVRSRWQW